ncbi:30S ribosomal protein S11 [Candidatus Gracilibacteria bacterium 28_42_T64]|nr:30S ribosomal protein S11 [Candidatus Gracilibacteria bacterium 28_42_T64]
MANTVKKSKKTRNVIPHGQVHIQASFNNTIISVTDEKGNVLTWATGGSAGFKGARESTPYAAQITAEQAVKKAKTLHSIESVDVYVKGIGIGREQAIRGIISGGVELKSIFDITPIPHNGCRKKKVRKL